MSAALIIIAGGGIAGLAAALALARRGMASHIVEQRAEFSEAGAGIQIGPNGMRVLQQLGIAEALAPLAAEPGAIVVRRATCGRILARLPLGPWMRERYGAPYWTIHRRGLQAALLASARAEPRITITNGASAVAVDARRDDVSVTLASGDRLQARALLIADGLHSMLRNIVAPGMRLVPAGKAAYRAVIPRAVASTLLDATETGVWLADGAHVVHYPIEGGASVAVVVVVPDDRARDGWAAAARFEDLTCHLGAFVPELGAALAAVPEWRSWSLAVSSPAERLARGRVALIGDAGHPMLPFLAQGGVMALEDAVVVAAELARPGVLVDEALARYDDARRTRVRQVVAASRRNGMIYHLSGLPAAARDLALATVPPARLMSRYDWLYGWRPPE